jgi:hypothetical protein
MSIDKKVQWIAGIACISLFFTIFVIASLIFWEEIDQFQNVLAKKVETWELWEFKTQLSLTYPVLLAVSSSLLVLGSICLMFAKGELSSLNKPKPGSKLLLLSFIVGTFFWTLWFSLLAEVSVISPGVIVLYFMIAPAFWFLLWIGRLSEKHGGIIWELVRWVMTTFIVALASTMLSLMSHPLTSFGLITLTLPGFVGLILNLIAWDNARKGKSAIRWAIAGGILMLINPLSLLIFPAIPSILCIIGGIRCK